MRDWVDYVRKNLQLAGFRPAREAEIVEEVARQLQDAHREAVLAGASEEEACRRAEQHISDWDGLREELAKSRRGRESAMGMWQEKAEERDNRRRGRFSLLTDLRQDTLYGLRVLRKSPGFTTVAVLTLALGIGATISMFSVLYAVWLNPLPYADAGRLVAMVGVERGHEIPFSYPDFADVRARSRSFAGLGIYDSMTATLTGHGRPEQLHGAIISPDLLAILGARPELGRNFFPEAHAGQSPEGLHEIILSHSLWQDRFGSDPSLVGKTITLDSDSYVVVGVMPKAFRFPIQATPADYWRSMAVVMRRVSSEGAISEERGNHSFEVMGRLKPGVPVTQADSELSTIAAALGKQYPDTNANSSFHTTPMLDQIVGD